MRSSEKDALLGSQDNGSWLDVAKRNGHLILVCGVLSVCIGLVGALIGLNVNEVADLKGLKEGGELALTAGNGLAAISDELIARMQGNGTYTSMLLSQTITKLVASTLANKTYRDLVTTEIVSARAASVTNFPVLVAAYGKVVSSILTLAYSAIARGSVVASREHLGLVCLGSHAQRLAAPFIYMSDFIRPSWGPDQYRSFLGSLDDEPCGALLPETMMDDEEWEILNNAPGIIGSPNPSVFGSVSVSRNARDLVARGDAWQLLFAQLAATSLDAYDNAIHDAHVALAMSCCTCAMLVAMLFLAPQVSLNTDSARSDIRNVFRQIEATVKLLSRYVQVLHTCSVREGEWARQEGDHSGFLWRVISFVQSVRPYVPQSSFGDIENVPITGQSNVARGGSLRMDSTSAAASAAQAIRELRLRDLRPDMGMQIVSGTVMCVSLAPFQRESDAMGDDAMQDGLRTRWRSFLSCVETCVNGTTGVIHTIAGDHLVALWNVTSSTSSPRVCAVHTALQLVKALGQQNEGVSIGITQSFLLAGNVEIGQRKQLAVCGPAVALAERLEGCNAAHKTSIMVDQSCAEALTNTVIADFDFAIRPVVLLRLKEDADDYVTGFAIYPHRIRQERLKAWNILFKELGTRLRNGALADALLDVDEYKTKYASSEAVGQVTGKQRTAAGGNSRNVADRSAESWKRNLVAGMRVIESSQRLAHEFGV